MRSALPSTLEPVQQAAGLLVRSDARMSFLSELFATTDVEKLREIGKRKFFDER